MIVCAALCAGCGRFGFAASDGTESNDADIDTPLDASGLCTEGAANVERFGACYSRFDAPVSYVNAAAACASIDAHLATFTTVAEADIAAELGANNTWIGLSDRYLEGTFTWQSGEPMPVTRWSANQPDANGNCVDASTTGQWDDTNCSTPKPYFCERSLATPPCIEGDVRVEFGGHCYYRTATDTTYAGAVTACLAAGAHPPVITSAAENAAVLTLFQDWSWIGLRDLPQPDTFEWDTGERLVYTNWVPGEPNNPGGTEHCAHIWNTGAWNNSVCDQAIAQIMCERP